MYELAISAVRDVFLALIGLTFVMHLSGLLWPDRIERLRLRPVRVYSCPKCGTAVRHMELVSLDGLPYTKKETSARLENNKKTP